MRTIHVVMCLLVVSLSQSVFADDTSSRKSESPSTLIEIETRFVTIHPDFPKLCESFGLGKEGFVPPAPEAESLFSADSSIADGSESISLISASTVVEERNPIYVDTVPLKTMMELIKPYQHDSRTNVISAPEVTVKDCDTAEIADVRKRPFVVDNQNGQPIVRESEEGTTLLVRPRIKSSGAVQLDLHARFSQIEDVNVFQKSENRQIQSPRIKTTRIEVSASLNPGETLAIWGESLGTPEVTEPATGLAKIVGKKPAVKTPESSLVLLITPKILGEKVASTTGK